MGKGRPAHAGGFGYPVRVMKTPRVIPAVSLAALAFAAALATAVLIGAAEVPAGAPAVPPPAAALLPIEHAVLTPPPHVPPPITRQYTARVVVKLEVVEKVGQLVDGVDYTFWTYGGTVPGSFIRVREGDEIEFHLTNPSESKLPHNIDLHAVTGPGGGATPTLTAPGQTRSFTFRALQPGLYVYHCATTPVATHVANGMYGLMLVEPKDGLPHADKEYYVMQGEFYTTGKYGEFGYQEFDAAKALDERPTYVVFNGAVGSLTGKSVLTANVGETVRLYFGVGGPNLSASFHVIGETFDRVYAEGAFDRPARNVSTVLVPSGGTAVVELKADVPGTFALTDHSLSRAFDKGALGMLKVTGEPAPAVYAGADIDATYLGTQSDAAAEAARNEAELTALFAVAVRADPKLAGLSKDIQGERGKQVYLSLCYACHQADGKGLPGAFPPLAKSDYLLADRERAIRIVLKGLSGPVTVNGVSINSAMPALEGILSDWQIADVLSYVYNAWGNEGAAFKPAEVKAIRHKNR
jgi:nitrite reductase (NO-forming)